MADSAFLKWIEVMSKAALALAGLCLTYLGYSYEKTSAATDLLIEQERGDIEIRAEMFSKITDQLVGQKDDETSIIEDVLLVQVLALNFHELIELKPIMLHLDDEISRKINNPSLREDDEDEQRLRKSKNDLRSIARRIRDRQLSSLTNISDEIGIENSAFIQYISLIDIPEYSEYKKEVIKLAEEHFKNKNEFSKELKELTNQYKIEDSKKDNTCRVNKEENNVPFGELVALDGVKEDIKTMITVEKPKSTDWDRQRFEVKLRLTTLNEHHSQTKSHDPNDTEKTGGNDPIIKVSDIKTADFSVTPYELPYIDNSLDASGNRYSVLIDKVCNNQKHRSVRLALVYFPKNFYPTRDRPVSYDQLKAKISGSSDFDIL